MKVHMEKDIAEDLISYKKRNIQEQINQILNRWNETEASAFLEKARNGTYSGNLFRSRKRCYRSQTTIT
jgi:hypothetical protein